MLRAGWNGAERTRGHNARDREIRTRRTTGGRVQKAVVTGGGIRLVSLKICKWRAGGLETALRVIQQGNVDVRFLQEKKLMQGIHTRNGVGYNVWETEAESRHWGGSSSSLESGEGIAGG